MNETASAKLPTKTREIIALASDLIRIPSVTVGAAVRFDEVRRAAALVHEYLRGRGLDVRLFDGGPYPSVLAAFPGCLRAPVMLNGHFDVVAPEPDDSQFVPRLDGDYLVGRGSADMKVVAATFMVWMGDALDAGPPYPGVNLLLIGNEETGESEAVGTPHVLALLEAEENGYRPDLLIAGERTEESGEGLWGEICTENRGIARLSVTTRGARGHSGMSSRESDLTERLVAARAKLLALAERYLTLDGGSWRSQIRFPFFEVGIPGVYNITADRGSLGVEVRVIPEDDPAAMFDEFRAYCVEHDLEIGDYLLEEGIACDPANPYLARLIEAVRQTSNREPILGRKLAGTSARFAPGGNGVVWGQSGIGPHARDERHHVPSILPFYRALDAFGSSLRDL